MIVPIRCDGAEISRKGGAINDPNRERVITVIMTNPNLQDIIAKCGDQIKELMGPKGETNG